MGTNSKEETIQLKAEMLQSLEIYEGNVKLAAERANISERTHYRWCRKDRAYKNAAGSIRDIRIRHIKEKLLEIAMKKIEDGNITTLNKMLGLTFKNFDEEIRLSNIYNDNPYGEEDDDDE